MPAPVRQCPQSEVYRLEPDPHISARKDNSQQGVLEMPHGMRDAMEVGSVEPRGEEYSLGGGLVGISVSMCYRSQLEGDEGGQNVCVWALRGKKRTG